MTTIHPTHTCFDDVKEWVAAYLKDKIDSKRPIILKHMICHGIMLLENGEPYSHAWIEDMDTKEVIDFGVLNGDEISYRVDLSEYYPRRYVQKVTKYSIREVAKICSETDESPWKKEYSDLCSDALDDSINFDELEKYGKTFCFKDREWKPKL